jgi:hypothetical protein
MAGQVWESFENDPVMGGSLPVRCVNPGLPPSSACARAIAIDINPFVRSCIIRVKGHGAIFIVARSFEMRSQKSLSQITLLVYSKPPLHH